MSLSDRQREIRVKVIDLFEKEYSLVEIRDCLKNEYPEKYLTIERLKEIIKDYLKKKDKISLEVRDFRDKMYATLIKSQLKKDFIEIYRKVGFMESFAELEKRIIG